MKALLLLIQFMCWIALLSRTSANRARSSIDVGFPKEITWDSSNSIADRNYNLLQSSVTPKPSWCTAKSTSDDSTLQAALDYACGQTTADCKPIKYGHPCFEPNTVRDHASYVFNSYFQINEKAAGTCDFGGAGAVTTADPSTGSCIFPSSGSLNQTTAHIQENSASRLVKDVYNLLSTCLWIPWVSYYLLLHEVWNF